MYPSFSLSMDRCCFMFVISVLLLWTPAVNAQSMCVDVCPSNSTSNINVTVLSNTVVNITWSSSFGSSNLELRYREQSGDPTSFIIEGPFNDNSFSLTNLMSGTDYEVQVCQDEDCGGCLMCFTTHPGPLQGVKASAVDPRSFTVDWISPGIDLGTTSVIFFIYYGTDIDNLDMVLMTVNDRLTVVTNNVMADTTYFVAVSYERDIGPSPLSEIVSVTTKALNDDPGILLYSFGTKIEQYPVGVASDLGNSDTGSPLIDTGSFMVQDIDYDYNHSHLYVTTNENSIVRFNYTSDSQFTSLTVNESEVLYNGLGDTQSIAVDWITERLYWFEFKSGSTQIYSAPFTGGSSDIKRHGLPIQGSLDSFTADPIHGYFYWTHLGSKLVRINYSHLVTATSDTDISSLVTVLAQGSKISSFTLDLADLQYFYISNNNTRMVRVRLSGNQEFISSTVVSANPTIKASFGDLVALIFDNLLFFRSSDYDSAGKLVTTASNLFDAKMVRSSYQPQPNPPGPPTDIKVLARNISAYISWNQPSFASDIFGPDAFSDWEYSVDYRPLEGSSDESYTMVTTNRSVTIPNLTPGVTYTFNITIRGASIDTVSVTTPDTYLFTTFGSDEEPRLLVTTNQGVLGVDTLGDNSAYLSAMRVDASSASASNSYLSPVRYFISDDGGDFFIQDGDSFPDESELRNRNRPMYLQLDWISRKLYWVEQQRKIINRISTMSNNLSGSVEQFEMSSESITGMALDAKNGVVFWLTSESGIIGRGLNGLVPSWSCHSMNDPRAIALDPANNRMFLAYFTGSMLNIATLEYTTFSCDSSSLVSREVSNLQFNSAKNISLAYGANTLYLAQESQFTVYSLSAEFSVVDSTYQLALGSIDTTPSDDIPTELRALSVVLRDNQPLPDSILENMYFDISGNLDLLTPPTPGLPVLNMNTSNTTFIDIMWEPSQYILSSVFYQVDLRLTTAVEKTVSLVMTNVLSGNSIQLSDQSFSTEVVATITPYSVWYGGEKSSNTFFSPAAVPAQVQNVRVNVFFPIREETSVVTAQIVWDGLTIEQAGGMISHYSINVFNDNNMLITSENEFNRSNTSNASMQGVLYNGPPFIVSSISTEFSLTLSGIRQFILYPLRIDRNYSVMVQAVNSAGAGDPSEEVIFSTTGPSPPREVVVVSPGGGYIVGDEDSDTMLPLISPPIALNNINRTLYYYTKTNNSFYRGSLDRNVDPVVVTQLRDYLEPLAFTFDWISETVYIIARNTQTQRLEVWTVFEPRQVAVFIKDIDEFGVPPRNINVSAIINPFKGYLSWTQATADNTELYLMNLRDNSVTCINGCNSNKRSVDLSTLSITGALTQDPLTQDVWLCDSNTGNILVCNVSSTDLTNCKVAVNASSLGQSPNGLPADQLSIDENTIYWSKFSDSTVYYTERADPSELLTFDVLLSDDFIMVGVSPGQQPLPVSSVVFENGAALIDVRFDFCLSPDYDNPSLQPVPSLVSKTNTSMTLTWNSSSLPNFCDDIVFSLLPSSYLIEITRVTDSSDKMEKDTYATTTVIDGLEPYTGYTFHITASNKYTPFKGVVHGDDRTYMTTEGVPSAIDTLQVLVYGPRHIYVVWEPLDPPQLRGDNALQTFILYRDNITIGRGLLNTNDEFTSLDPDSTYTFGVAVSNNVLTSPTSVVMAQTFSLPPSAVTSALGPRAFSINVTLTEEHANITGFTVKVDGSQFTSEVIDTSLPYPQLFQYTRDDSNVTPFTVYSVVIEATYASFNFSNRIFGPVMDTSTLTNVRTDSSVPDYPDIELVNDKEIRWEAPKDNGEEITKYILSISYIRDGENRSDVRPVDISENARMIKIDDDLTPIQDAIYYFSLQAMNANGLSNSSREVSVTTLPAESFGLNEALMYIVAPVGSLLVLIFILLLIICCCCLCATPDKRATFRPDYELIRLREDYAKSRQHAFNPNYMWTRDDYTTYQDDLDNMNKFPRNKLRLENFIDRGEFGEVYQGTAIDILAADSGPTPVAVKTMRKGATQDEKEKFLSEAALMSNFNHQNIVKVLGVCLDNDPIFIIMELMPAGDLLKFLREARQESGPPLLTLAEQIQIAIDVGQGCRYLEQQHFIHRDIAGRNCLVTSKGADRVVKIGDFGLAKDLYTSDYYQVEGQRKLPVRWMAPEALLQGKFTIETDIWSYGVLLWEIFTFGNQPYPGRNNQEVLQFVTGGGRLEKPENCSIRVYKLMQACWENPSERLHFAQIVEYLAHYLEHVNNKRDSYYSDDDEEGGGDGDEEFSRKNSKPSRTSSVRSVGLINLARQGSVRIRRSIRVRASLKKDDIEANQNHTGLNSEENLVDDGAFRERGPF